MSSRWFRGTALESRRALRGLGRSPGFAVAVVLVLGIAIAGTVTVATAAYELFLKPLPYDAPEQLVRPTAHSRSMGFELGLPPAMLSEVRSMPMVASVEAYEARPPIEAAEGTRWHTAGVTVGLIGQLGVAPVIGRALDAADAEPGSQPVALMGEDTWRNRYGSDPSVIGRELELAGERVRIVGVVPQKFTVPSSRTELWLPLRFTPDELAPDQVTQFTGLQVVVRLKPGHTAAQFQDALLAFYAEDPRLAGVRDFMGLEFQVQGLRQAWTEEQRQPLAIIGLASLLVLTAAVLNMAGLWLARLLGQSHEQAIQAALGAGPWRSLGRTLVELGILGSAAAAVALLLVPWALEWLRALGMLDPAQPLSVRTGPATLLATLAVVVISSIPVIAAAGWQVRRQRRGLAVGLAGGGRGHAGSAARARRLLIVTQIALAMSILSAMTLLLKSWHGLLTEDLGFEPRRLLAAQVYTPETQQGKAMPYQPDPNVRAALERVRGLPGVSAAAHTSVAPFTRSESITSMPVPGQADRETSVRTRSVGDEYFRVTGIEILRGRPLGAGGTASSPDAVVVDEYFASLYFPERDVVGSRIRIASGAESYREVEIVGVARTAKYRAPDEEPDRGTIYLYRAEPISTATLLIAADLDPATLVAPVKTALERHLDPDRIGSVVTMEALVRRTVRDREPQLILLGVFAGETVLLAAIGLFSLLAYSVRARTAEFGVRQAVGAKPAHIRRHVLADAARLLLPGLVFGMAGACIAGYLVADRLHEVSPADPATWLVTGGVLAFVVLAAGLWPARRAARIQPTEALRYE